MEVEAAEQKKGLLKKVSKSFKKAKKSLRKSLSSRKSLSRSNSATNTFFADEPGTARETVDGKKGSDFGIRRSFSESDSRPRDRKSPFLGGKEAALPSRRLGSYRYESSEGRAANTTGSDGWTEPETVDSTVDSPRDVTVSPGSKLLHSVDSATPSPTGEAVRQRGMAGSLLAERRKNSAEEKGRSSFSEEARELVEPIVVSSPDNEKQEPLSSKVVQESAVLGDNAGVTVRVESVTPAVKDAPKVVQAEVVETGELVNGYQGRDNDDENTEGQETKIAIDADKTSQDVKVAEKQTEEFESNLAVGAESVPAVETMSNEAAPVVAVAVASGDSEAVVDHPAGETVEKKDPDSTQELFSRISEEITTGGLGSKLGEAGDAENTQKESVPLGAPKTEEVSQDKVDEVGKVEAASNGSNTVDAADKETLPVDAPGVGTVFEKVDEEEIAVAEHEASAPLKAAAEESVAAAAVEDSVALDAGAPEEGVVEEMEEVFDSVKVPASLDASVPENVSTTVKEVETVSAAVKEAASVDIPGAVSNELETVPAAVKEAAPVDISGAVSNELEKMEPPSAPEIETEPELSVASLKEVAKESITPVPVADPVGALLSGSEALPVVEAEIERKDAVAPPEEVIEIGEKDGGEKLVQNPVTPPEEVVETGEKHNGEKLEQENAETPTEETVAIDGTGATQAVLKEEKIEHNDADTAAEKAVIVEEEVSVPVQTELKDEKMGDKSMEATNEEDSPADFDEESDKESELDVIPEGAPLEHPAPEAVENVPSEETTKFVAEPDADVEMKGTVDEGSPSNAVVAGEEEDLGLQVKSTQTREFSLADVEAVKAKRNSCSLADEGNRGVVAQSGAGRHSADVSDFRIEEEVVADGGGQARKRWRWVRRVVAPVTVVTGALLIGISKIQ